MKVEWRFEATGDWKPCIAFPEVQVLLDIDGIAEVTVRMLSPAFPDGFDIHYRKAAQ